MLGSHLIGYFMRIVYILWCSIKSLCSSGVFEPQVMLFDSKLTAFYYLLRLVLLVLQTFLIRELLVDHLNALVNH